MILTRSSVLEQAASTLHTFRLSDQMASDRGQTHLDSLVSCPRAWRKRSWELLKRRWLRRLSAGRYVSGSSIMASHVMLILLYLQCAVGFITTFQSSPSAFSDLPLEWVSVTVSAFGLDSRRNVIPVATTLSIVCGPRDHCTPEGVAERHPIWTSLDRSGTGHDLLPGWTFPAYPFLASGTVNEGMGTCEVDLAEVAIQAFEATLEATAYE